jgi:hypothetical protein
VKGPGNPAVRVFLVERQLDFIRETLARHAPTVAMRPSERAMEMSSAQLLGEALKGVKASPTLPLWSWSEIQHAIACRWKRGDEKGPCLTLYRWIEGRIAANPEAMAVRIYWRAVARAEAQAAKAQRAAEAAAAAAQRAASRVAQVRRRGR